MKTLLTLVFALVFGASASAKENPVEQGKASWYSVSCNGGTRTASGKRLQNNAMTAAHRTLPFGSVIKVTNLSNGKSVDCTVQDRGPFVRGRIVDVTVGAAEVLGFKGKGITTVKVEVVRRGK